MKALFLLFLLLGPLRASELTFDVVHEDNSQKGQEHRLRVFLDAYDIFSAAVRDGAIKARMRAVDQEMKLPPARLSCDPKTRTLRIVFDSDPPAPELETIAETLIHVVHFKDIQRRLESLAQLTAKMVALKKEVDAEPAGPRRRILEALLEANSATADGPPPPPFPLRLRKNG